MFLVFVPAYLLHTRVEYSLCFDERETNLGLHTQPPYAKYEKKNTNQRKKREIEKVQDESHFQY